MRKLNRELIRCIIKSSKRMPPLPVHQNCSSCRVSEDVFLQVQKF